MYKKFYLQPICDDLMKRVIKIYLFRAERIAIINISKIVPLHHF